MNLPEELLKELQIEYEATGKKQTKIKKCLKVMNIWCIVVSVCIQRAQDSSFEETKLHPEEVFRILVSLELQGYIREISKNYYIKVK